MRQHSLLWWAAVSGVKGSEWDSIHYCVERLCQEWRVLNETAFTFVLSGCVRSEGFWMRQHSLLCWAAVSGMKGSEWDSIHYCGERMCQEWRVLNETAFTIVLNGCDRSEGFWMRQHSPLCWTAVTGVKGSVWDSIHYCGERLCQEWRVLYETAFTILVSNDKLSGELWAWPLKKH